ncbi:MAG TPA: hypothetical protein VKP78_05110 [bacterium]|nr:hypothetical protein [bacterium]
MNYFKVLGTIFGLVAALKPFYIHLLPYDENKLLEKAYSSKRPAWVLPAGIAGLLLVGFTWYKELTTEIPYSIILTLVFSLTAIKAFFFIFDYQKFQKWVAGMLAENKGKKIVVLDIFVGILGLAIIVAAWLLY